MTAVSCSLCDTDGGALVWRGAGLRVVRADEAGFPAFYRVIRDAHVAEFSDLPPGERTVCMDAVVAVELALRESLQPAKINIASLGNVVPHLHWHVIARFAWDSRFPAPVWGAAVRDAQPSQLADIAALLPQAEAVMRQKLSALVA